jgi:hypothetical protein
VGSEVIDRQNYILPSLKNEPRFADPKSYDFHLTSDSPAEILDRGVPPGRSSTGYDLTPKLQYVYDAGGERRPVSGALDLGAFEYAPPARTPQTVRGSSRTTHRRP